MSDEDWPKINADDPNEQQRYLWALRGRYAAEAAAIDSAELQRLVRCGLDLCNPLDIKEPQQVVRFLALSFLITPEQRASEFISRTYQLVVERTDVPARRRMNFLFMHLVGRPSPSVEPDFGPWLVRTE